MKADRNLFRKLSLLLAMSLIPVVGTAQLPNRADPLPGITTSGQPTESALSELADEGYVAVIDLRGENEDRGIEEAATVERLGMRYVSIPVSGAAGVSYENAEALDAALADLEGPVLIHCASSNRVGALLSLRQHLLGENAADSLALGLEAGLSSPALRETVETRLGER
jgi:uncharacterized protein (TIGR01244 family)